MSEKRDEPSLIACNTCRFSAQAQENRDGQRGGAIFAALLKERGGDIAIEETSCLFACTRFCTVHLRAPGKVGYVLGDFRPRPEDAEALLAFVQLYRDSASGAVPYALWPQGVKGHFIVRIPAQTLG